MPEKFGSAITRFLMRADGEPRIDQNRFGAGSQERLVDLAHREGHPRLFLSHRLDQQGDRGEREGDEPEPATLPGDGDEGHLDGVVGERGTVHRGEDEVFGLVLGRTAGGHWPRL
ncbi:hypothetical protein BU52_05975 [Streptomyces toyocaensis]|uniref:Uncharacterized protein n=1 Tax=Streptomyces toyocaensis TaxID=55952 RepID=A0A081XWQ1_STRTO|nr:hypothetical protein BU52_05975 [Streptomyces toyocaensis]